MVTLPDADLSAFMEKQVFDTKSYHFNIYAMIEDAQQQQRVVVSPCIRPCGPIMPRFDCKLWIMLSLLASDSLDISSIPSFVSSVSQGHAVEVVWHCGDGV